MDDIAILQKINADIGRGSVTRAIYLEGSSDPDYFFPLLGIHKPTAYRGGYIHQQTLVRGLSTSDGSGNQMVRRYVDVAVANGLTGSVFGIVDGDGMPHVDSAKLFDAPHVGPLFTWKAYSIESFIPCIPWNSNWGVEPAWRDELKPYAPYVALNQLHVHLRGALATLRLAKYANPMQNATLLVDSDVRDQLQKDQGVLTNYDVAVQFDHACAAYRDALDRMLEEGLALFNGKWLFQHFFLDRFRQTPSYWQNEWVAHAVASGGLPEVRDLWLRITGTLP